MEKRVLVKPDGRKLILYGRRPIPGDIVAPSPRLKAAPPGSGHFRYHPLRGEWVIYAAHRQNRTFVPPPGYDPLDPERDPERPTEVPSGDYQVCAFENLFPSLSSGGAPPEPMNVPVRPSAGACEVVVYDQDARTSLGALPLEQIELILSVWADRTHELGNRDDVEYVFIFENRGAESGATIHHPHCQIYAYPFIPPIPAAELRLQADHLEKGGTGLFADLIRDEIADGRRVLFHDAHAVAFVPVCARHAYEVWVAPIRPAATFCDLNAEETPALARALKTVLLKFDNLWAGPFPYVMVWHQAPADGRPHPEAHLHAEFYPPYRMRGRLKFLAGSEIGAGVFTSDTLPEERAKELQNVHVEI